MVSALVANWLIKMPLAYLLALPLNLGTDGVWWSISISVLAELLILLGLVPPQRLVPPRNPDRPWSRE